MELSPEIALDQPQPKMVEGGAAVNPSRTVIGLSLLIAVLALLAAGAGLLGGRWEPASFTTVHGENVDLFGAGLYRNDSLMTGAGFLGQDAVVLFLGIPLLLGAAHLYRRGSLRGGLLLFGTLGFFLYVYVSMAFSAAYNPLFLAYIALLSASLFALALTFASINRRALAAQALPRRGPALFLFAGGLVTLFVWGLPLLDALLRGGPPDRMFHYTTMVTSAFDLAVITPATFVAGYLLLRRAPLGYVLAFPLLILIILLLPVIILMTAFQVAAGIAFTVPEFAGPIAGFALLGLFALWVLAALLRNLQE